MNPVDTLTTLFDHHRWANLRIIEVCAALTDEQLDATIVGTFGSIRDTLQHIATAERSYLSRISTGQPYRRPADAPPLAWAEMADSLRASGSGLAASSSSALCASIFFAPDPRPVSLPTRIVDRKACCGPANWPIG